MNTSSEHQEPAPPTPPPTLQEPKKDPPPVVASALPAHLAPELPPKAVNLLAPSVFRSTEKSASTSSFRELFAYAAPASEGPWDSEDDDDSDILCATSSRRSVMSDDSFQKELEAAGYDK
uniref:FH2 domain-containing protein n=1 Tax=Caenorhabditis tropicalis TaxID=1561998 RepID=A0A1I7UD28_9PELO